MSVTIILRAHAKPADIENFKTYIAKCLPETRSYNGCINIDIYEDKSNKGSFVFYENWESVNAYEAYLEYRTKQGYGRNRFDVDNASRDNLTVA